MTTINAPTEGNNKKNSNINKLSSKNKNKISETLFGNEKAILKDLKENYVKIEENQEMLGYNGKIVHITLPKVGEFKGFKFDYFISSEEIDLKIFNENPQIKDLSHTRENIVNLLEAINDYMKARGVIIDEKINKVYHYESLNQRGGSCNVHSDAGRIFQEVTGLKYGGYSKSCRLKDKVKDEQVALWYYYDFYFYAHDEGYNVKNRLFLKTSN